VRQLKKKLFFYFKDGQFVNAILTDNGQPVIYMSNNCSYFYSLNTQCWHKIPTINNNIAINSYIELNFPDNTTQPPSTIGPLSMAQLREKNEYDYYYYFQTIYHYSISIF
jgi:hypothetical protein